MDLPFSTEELEEILRSDTGFKNLLDALPESQANQLKQFITDHSILKDALNFFPDTQQNQAINFFNDIVNTPQKAVQLYEECRFFEARELLLKSIDLYSRNSDTSLDFLNKATGFVIKRVQALFYTILGDVEWELGNTEDAGRYHRLSLDLAEELEKIDKDTIAKALHGLGVYYWNLGDMENGLQCCHKALDIISGQEDRWHTLSRALTTLSVIYSDIGQFDRALECGHQSVDLCIQRDDRKTLAISLNNLACLYAGHGDFKATMDTLEQGLLIARQEENPRQETLLLNNIAMCHLKDYPPACESDSVKSYLEKALSNSEKIGSLNLKAQTLLNMGAFCQVSGKEEDAKKNLLNAVEIYRRIGSKSGEATALNDLGLHLKCHMGDIEGACQAWESAIDILENIRGGLRKEAHRISYSDIAADPYEMIIDCLISMNRPDKAFEYVERAKSRTLLEFLSDRLKNQDIRESDPEAFRRAMALLKEIDEIQKNLESIHCKEETENHRGAENDYDSLANDLLEKLTEKERAFDTACEHLRAVDPERASLIRVMPPPLADIHGLPDGETLLLELYQSQEALQIFIVSQKEPVDVINVELSLNEAMDATRSLVTGLRENTSPDVRSHEFIRRVRKPLARFYELLIGPLSSVIDQYRRLIIAPHLCWHYFPFHALYNSNEKVYLCDRFEICYCPSASIFHLCRQKNRLGRDRALILSRNNGDLPHVDQEANLLSAAFSPNDHVFTGDKAHLGQIREGERPYDVIHMACHGQFHQEQPFLSGIDIPPQASEQRRTYLLDLFNLRLNSSLVTLSACDSGLAKFTSADELVGLSRGLFYAGAASVMLSLWQVSDESTCYLMENFYWHFVKNRQTKTRSLQLAMQAVKARKEYAHPYFWAPFVVMGDWR